MNYSGTLYTISAPSGAGKTSLVKALVEQDSQLFVSVSHTTRGQRTGEENGVNYYFVSRENFENAIRAETFFEWAEVFGNLYGTAVEPVERQLEAGHDVILEIDWQGAAQVKKRVPDSVHIFILPPSLDILRQRLVGRGQDSAEVIEGRMAQAQSELAHWPEADYLVVNDRFEQALDDLKHIVASQRLSRRSQSHKLASTLTKLTQN